MPDAPERPTEAPLRHTLFHIPPAVPFKNASSAYLKQDNQTIWSRNVRNILKETNAPLVDSALKGSDIIVIHPGSRWVRIGRATDKFPVSIPHVIARRIKGRYSPFQPLKRILNAEGNGEHGEDQMDTSPPGPSAEEVSECIHTIRSALRSRMTFYNIPYDEGGSKDAADYNKDVAAEQIEEAKDAYRVDWVIGKSEDETLIGHKVFRLADPEASGYQVRWPIYGNSFNTRYYNCPQAALNDLQTMWDAVLSHELRIATETFKQYSVVLLIPDYFDKHCVSQLVNMLLVHMKFRRVCVQQEGYVACLGSNLTTACVVDIGAVKTSVACVEDGLLLSDTRMLLDYGGDDITEFLHNILVDIQFPYRDIQLSRLYDLHVMDDLKARLCTLSEADVASRIYSFFLRAPGQHTQKYNVKAYDETIVAPMCIFEPKIIDFEGKRDSNPKRWDSEAVDDGDVGSDNPTQAMIISTQHLLNNVTPGGPPPAIDVKFEAGKLPLDVAIFNSVRAAGNDKIKKFLQTVLVVGGTALVPGAVHALESRLQAIAYPLVVNIERLSVTTSPPDVDPRVAAWKGATIISKLDLLSDMWITTVEWDMFGMRCLKERSLIERPSTVANN
ncbi:actin-like protein arp8 [Tulasnella sp. 403]|nr:actin-like protein arp8 [Tulasnella sp. 403]